MKFKTQIIIGGSLLLVASTASAHPGHEALGDGLHVEYLSGIGVASMVSIYALIRHRKGG